MLLADDSEIVRRAIRQVLATQCEIEIVGEAVDFGQTVLIANNLRQQVVVLDLRTPDETKITFQHVKSHLNYGAHLLAISSLNDEERKLAENLGADILLDKMALGDTLILTILQCAENAQRRHNELLAIFFAFNQSSEISFRFDGALMDFGIFRRPPSVHRILGKAKATSGYFQRSNSCFRPAFHFIPLFSGWHLECVPPIPTSTCLKLSDRSPSSVWCSASYGRSRSIE